MAAAPPSSPSPDYEGVLRLLRLRVHEEFDENAEAGGIYLLERLERWAQARRLPHDPDILQRAIETVIEDRRASATSAQHKQESA